LNSRDPSRWLGPNFDYYGRFLASAQASKMIAEPKCTAF
jgi:hypothetical protein